MKVPFLDLKPTYLSLQNDIDRAYRRVMNSGRYILGGEVEQFERQFSKYIGARYCIGVGNGLDAQILILKSHDIGVGDEVFITGLFHSHYGRKRNLPIIRFQS